MGFKEAVRTCVREKYARFSGRASRSEYWWFMLFVYGVSLLLFIPFLVLGGIDTIETGSFDVVSGIFIGVISLFFLAMFIPMISATVRRFHDRNLSGWWYLGLIIVGFVPVLGYAASIASIVITVLKGTEGDNKFGPDPLVEQKSADVFA